jgi:FkbM family methyltransferase
MQNKEGYCITDEEEQFFETIKNTTQLVFDVGCRNDTAFTKFSGEVHYFDPVKEFIDDLKTQENANSKSYFNNFGLSVENKVMNYYPKYQSFHDRFISCGTSDDANKFTLSVRKASDYIEENNISEIGFLKIDTEGHEFNVLKGFEDKIKIIKVIQFEYGGTYKDNGVKLKDVVEYLKSYGFEGFAYLKQNGTQLLTNCVDHYQYSNIVCFNSSF